MSKSTVILFVLVLLVVCQSATAAVIEVATTIKAVDVKSRGITVAYETKLGTKSIDLDVSRKAEIVVNGKKAALEAVKVGQKAKVSYEKELQVVVKIDATGKGDEPSREVCRFTLSVSEFGDCVVKVEQTTSPISAAAKCDGEPLKLKPLPNAEAWKASDGRCTIIHSFDHADELSSVFAMLSHTEINSSAGAVVFTTQKTQPAFASYGSFIQLPATVCYDRLAFQEDSGVILTLATGIAGSLNVNLGRGKDGKTFTGAFWIDVKDGKQGDRTQVLTPMPFDPTEGTERKFRLPLPNARIEDSWLLQFNGWGNNGGEKSELVRLLVQGRLHPVLGIGFGERSGVVFAQMVNHGSLAEKAGVKVGDVVVSINGQQPKSMKDAVSICRKLPLGGKATIRLRRGDDEQEVVIAD
jgi:hypothetical protein